MQWLKPYLNTKKDAAAERFLMVHRVNLAVCPVCFVNKAGLQHKQKTPTGLAPSISAYYNGFITCFCLIVIFFLDGGKVKT